MVVVTEKMRETSRANAAKLTKEDRRENEVRSDRLQAMMEADPQAFQDLLAKVAGKMLIPHSEGQAQVLTAEERFLVLCAGRRWGKTKVGAAKILREARKPGMRCVWVAPIYKVVKRGYAEVVAQIPDGLLTKPAPPDSVFDAGRSVRLQFKNGSTIEFYSADRPEGILGASFDFVIMDEAATMPEFVWSQIIRATLADRQGRALFISTPRQRNWFYYIWLRGQSDDPDDHEFRSWHFPSRTNPTIPSSEFDDMARDMPAVEYEQEVLAEFISEAASVFRFPKAYKEDGTVDHSKPTPALKPIVTPKGHVIVGLDLAKHTDWTVILGLNENGLPCHHDRFQQVSWPVQRQRIYDAVDTILETAEGVTILVDSGGPGDVIYDDLEEAGYDVIGINFTTYKEKMVKLLSSDLEQGNAFICEEQLSEFEHYAYTITGSGRWRYEAARGHDDEVSAALLAHWGRIHEGVPNVQTLHGGDTADSDSFGWDEEYALADDGEPQVTRITVRPPSAQDLLINDPRVWS